MCCDCCKALASFHTYPLFRTLSNAEHETDNYIDIITVLMGFAKPAMPQGTSHDIYSVSAQIVFQKNALFGQFLASEASQNKEGWVPPTPLPHLKF